MVVGTGLKFGQRRRVLFSISFVLLLGLAFRFYLIQIIYYDSYSNKSAKNSVRKIIKTAPRGIIYDRNLVPIVDNRPTYGLSLVPYDVTKEFNYPLFEKITDLPEEEIKSKIESAKKRFSRFKLFPLKRNVDFEERSRIEENKLEFPGVNFSEFPARTYPNDARLTHVLGYLRTVTDEVLKKADPELNYQYGDVFGFTGLERIYERNLRGNDGVEFRLVDIYGIDHGKYLTAREYEIEMGEPLILSIDSRLQMKAESLLVDKKGSIICMNPENGEVLAFVSSPDYDLNSFIGPIPNKLWDRWNQNSGKPLMNRGIQGTYPPGSIIKLISAAYALDNNIIDENWSVICNGAYSYGDRTFRCWNIAGHGHVDITQSIKYSCNIFYYQLIQKIRFENWSQIVSQFGFGKKTGIDLPGEKRGIVPTRKYMNDKYTSRGWGKGSLLNFVIGQGDMLATPQQVIQIMNLISTAGNSYEPHVRKGIDSKPLNVSLKKSTWKFLKEATLAVVNDNDGTGKNANSIFGKVAGKTGTAQNPHGEDHSWFSGYITLPNNKMMSLAVIVENGGKGSKTGASTARELFNEFAKLNK
jgi:penicillin-binding protein 2